jgi:hypothetical protein
MQGRSSRGHGSTGRRDWEQVFSTDDYLQQRGLEQYLYDEYNPALTRRRPISPRNMKMSIYLQAAKRFLELLSG